MIGYSCNKKDFNIAVGYMPKKRKPSLMVLKGNTATEYATFKSEKTALEFMDILADFFDIEKLGYSDIKGGGTDE